MSPLNEEQLHQIRDERKEQIMGAALKIFSRRGIVGTKMSMIASESGISHGLLYHYFKSKDELFTKLVQWAMEEVFATIGNIYDLPGSPMEKMRTLTQSIFRESDRHYFMLIYQASTADEVPEKAKHLIEQYSLKTFVEGLVPLFIDGQKIGQFAAGNPLELISSYFSVLFGLILLDMHGNKNYRIPKSDILLQIISGP